jgi:hypothetical protein
MDKSCFNLYLKDFETTWGICSKAFNNEREKEKNIVTKERNSNNIKHAFFFKLRFPHKVQFCGGKKHTCPVSSVLACTGEVLCEFQ